MAYYSWYDASSLLAFRRFSWADVAKFFDIDTKDVEPGPSKKFLRKLYKKISGKDEDSFSFENFARVLGFEFSLEKIFEKYFERVPSYCCCSDEDPGYILNRFLNQGIESQIECLYLNLFPFAFYEFLTGKFPSDVPCFFYEEWFIYCLIYAREVCLQEICGYPDERGILMHYRLFFLFEEEEIPYYRKKVAQYGEFALYCFDKLVSKFRVPFTLDFEANPLKVWEVKYEPKTWKEVFRFMYGSPEEQRVFYEVEQGACLFFSYWSLRDIRYANPREYNCMVCDTHLDLWDKYVLDPIFSSL